MLDNKPAVNNLLLPFCYIYTLCTSTHKNTPTDQKNKPAVLPYGVVWSQSRSSILAKTEHMTECLSSLDIFT